MNPHCILAYQGRNVSKEVIPDDSEGFQRPLDEIKLASLCAKFAPISILNDANFVCDDVMYIKCDLS